MDRLEKSRLSAYFFFTDAYRGQRNDDSGGRRRYKQPYFADQRMFSDCCIFGKRCDRFTKIQRKSFFGVLTCFSGILFIFWDGLADMANPDYRLGIVFLFIAIGGWASGTIFTKKLNIQSRNISLNLFYQFIFAGIVQLCFAFLFSESYNFENWSITSVSAMIYLAVFGSVAAFFAFHYALTRVSPVQVSILAYVNTIISIFLSWLILDETISAKFIIAAVLIIIGVFIINYNPELFKSKRLSK